MRRARSEPKPDPVGPPKPTRYKARDAMKGFGRKSAETRRKNRGRFADPNLEPEEPGVTPPGYRRRGRGRYGNY